jgi:hypothetical protein
LADARAAPRASAVSGSSGTLTASVVTASNRALIGAMSTPEPTTNRPSGQVASASAPEAIADNSATRSLSRSDWRRTSLIEPSTVSTTASVAVSGSTNSSAVLAYPTELPTPCASAAAAKNADTSMTFSTLRAASASRSAAPSPGSVHVTPVNRNRWPVSAAPSRVPRIAETTWSGPLRVGASAALTLKPSSSTVTPSAFSPSTKTMRTAVGAIDTPSTVSITSSKAVRAGQPGLKDRQPRPARHRFVPWRDMAAHRPPGFVKLWQVPREATSLLLLPRPYSRNAGSGALIQFNCVVGPLPTSQNLIARIPPFIRPPRSLAFVQSDLLNRPLEADPEPKPRNREGNLDSGASESPAVSLTVVAPTAPAAVISSPGP